MMAAKHIRGSLWVPLVAMPASQIAQDAQTEKHIMRLYEAGDLTQAMALAWTIKGRKKQSQLLDMILGSLPQEAENDEPVKHIGEEDLGL